MYTKFEFNSDQINIETGDANWLPLSVKINGRVYLTTIPEAVAPPPPKTPLFTTDDGVDMYEGMCYWSVSPLQFLMVRHKINNESYLHYRNHADKTFGSLEAANNYILENKQSISLNDVALALRNISLNDVALALRNIHERTGEYKPSPGLLLQELKNMKSKKPS